MVGSGARPWLAAACLGALACAPLPPRPDIVLVVVDTLRVDRLGSYGAARDTSPNLDALAAGGVRFERAYAPAPWTLPSVVSILTGLYPSVHGADQVGSGVPDSVATLAEILAAQGYATAGVVSHDLIGRSRNLAPGFEAFSDAEARGSEAISTPGVTRRAREQIAALRHSRPFFLFVHYFDPHYRYRDHPGIAFASPSGAGRFGAGYPRADPSSALRRLIEVAANPSGAERRYLMDLYDEEIRFTDEGIGSLLAALDDAGLAETAIVAVTADHGEEFFEHGSLGHSRTLYEELIRVPLILRLPTGSGVAAEVIEVPVSLVSLAPTLLDAAGIDPAAFDFQAPSLLPLIAGGVGPARPVYAEVDFVPLGGHELRDRTRLSAWIDGPIKLVRDEVTGSAQLFDLADDPGERRDRSARHPTLVAQLAGSLDRAVEQWRRHAHPPVAAPELTDDEVRALERLGYGASEGRLH